MKIDIKNFQAHGHTTLDVPEGFSCIVGPSNIGKSSIVRAVRWLLYDSLRGSRFVRKGQNQTEVILDFEDGNRIIRAKGKNENSFQVGLTKYASIGVGIPPEVSQALNIKTILVDKDSDLQIHVSNQLDSPFLIFESPSSRAKIANILSGGNFIDVAVRETKRKHQEIEKKRSSLTSDLERNKTELVRFDGLEDRKAKLDSIRDQFQSLSDLEQYLEKLFYIQADLKAVSGSLIKFSAQGQKLSVIDDAELSAALELEDSLRRLEDTKRDLDQTSSLVRQCQLSIASTEADLVEARKQLEELPDFECPSCGQLVTKEVRERQVVTR